MLRALPAAVMLSLTLSPAAAYAADAPGPPSRLTAGATDFVRLWRPLPLIGGADPGLVATYVKFLWITPQLGASAVYSTSGSAALRVMGRTELPLDLTVTAMGGYRGTGVGLPASPSPYRHGPELVLLLTRPLGWGLAATLRGSYAMLWPGSAMPADDSVTGLGLYGANLTWSPTTGTTLVAGMLGQVTHRFGGGLTGHNLGPLLGLQQRF